MGECRDPSTLNNDPFSLHAQEDQVYFDSIGRGRSWSAFARAHRNLYDKGYRGWFACYANGEYYGAREDEEQAALLCEERKVRDAVLAKIGCYRPARG